MIKSFRDMSVWQNSFQLSISVFNLTKGLPRSEDYALTSQIRRSSNSVSANIAEAFGRRTSKDKIYFYTVSRGSAYETQNHLLYGEGVEYFDKEQINQLVDQYDNLIHELNRITNKLERKS
ncbi:four helix bundle protein [Rhodohalobacter sp. 8-1]|uniref:four helix bundle protein n=1 Tax=Rhodohalobacter sp. 8-1 TaxID=3131972 RepID=UPI0030ECEAAB